MKRKRDFSRLRQVEIADLAGVTARHVRRWTAAGMPRRADGRYDASAVVAWLRWTSQRWCTCCGGWHG